MIEVENYKELFDFFEAHLSQNFKDIDKEDPLLKRANELMDKNNQFFYIADMIRLEILYTNASIKQVLGYEATAFTPILQFELLHPEDSERFNVSRARMMKSTGDLFAEKKGYDILSVNFRFQHKNGHFVNTIIQGFVFYSSLSRPSSYGLFVNTDINWFGPIKHGHHFYSGKDLSYFRIPDKKLILTGCIFTDREFEIIKLLRDISDSHEIGEKLFISTHTVNTHRRNILKKTGFHNTSDLILNLQKKGFF